MSYINNIIIQFLQEKNYNFLYIVGFTDEELEFFEIHFEALLVVAYSNRQ